MCQTRNITLNNWIQCIQLTQNTPRSQRSQVSSGPNTLQNRARKLFWHHQSPCERQIQKLKLRHTHLHGQQHKKSSSHFAIIYATSSAKCRPYTGDVSFKHKTFVICRHSSCQGWAQSVTAVLYSVAELKDCFMKAVTDNRRCFFKECSRQRILPCLELGFHS